MSPRKRVISIFLILVLLVTAPFSIVYADDSGYTPDDVNLIAARNFFLRYGLNGVEPDNTFTLNCTNSVTEYCQLYSGSVYDSTVFHRLFVASGSSFNRYSAYNTSNRIRVTTQYLYITFLSNTNFTSANSVAYPQSGYTVDFSRLTNDAQTSATPNGFYLITFKIKANTVPSAGNIWVTIDMPGTASTVIVPIFYGLESQMSDNIHRLVFGTGQSYSISDAQTHTLLNTINSSIQSANDHLYGLVQNTNTINVKLNTTNSYLKDIRDGTSASTSSVNTVDSANQSLSQDFSQLSTIESGYNTDFNNQIQSINFNDQLSGQQGFLTSSSFVINVFNQLILNNPLTILIIIVSIFYVFRRFV